MGKKNDHHEDINMTGMVPSAKKRLAMNSNSRVRESQSLAGAIILVDVSSKVAKKWTYLVGIWIGVRFNSSKGAKE